MGKECTKNPPRSFFNNLRPIRTNSDYKLHTWDNCNYFPIRRAYYGPIKMGRQSVSFRLEDFLFSLFFFIHFMCILQPPTKKQLQCTRHDDKIVVSPTLPFLLLLYICWACIIISGKKYPRALGPLLPRHPHPALRSSIFRAPTNLYIWGPKGASTQIPENDWPRFPAKLFFAVADAACMFCSCFSKN